MFSMQQQHFQSIKREFYLQKKDKLNFAYEFM